MQKSMKTMIYQDRRKTPRYVYSALAVLKTPDGPSVAEAQILDISLEGACVNVPLPLFPDEEFLLVMTSNEGDIVVRGIVRYTQPDGTAGLNFTRMSEKATTRLQHLIQMLMETTMAGQRSPAGTNPPIKR
jgi:hypothetical protein